MVSTPTPVCDFGRKAPDFDLPGVDGGRHSLSSARGPNGLLVMFICRSGGRSHNAAMLAQQAGYSEAYNVLEGFEGDRDAQGHRNTIGGWRAAGLPWTQG